MITRKNMHRHSIIDVLLLLVGFNSQFHALFRQHFPGFRSVQPESDQPENRGEGVLAEAQPVPE